MIELHSDQTAFAAMCVGIALFAAVVLYVEQRIRDHRARRLERRVLLPLEEGIVRSVRSEIRRPRVPARTCPPKPKVSLPPGWRLTADGGRIFVGERA